MLEMQRRKEEDEKADSASSSAMLSRQEQRVISAFCLFNGQIFIFTTFLLFGTIYLISH
jgi:hypothetical protein